MHGAQGRLLERPPLQGRRLGGPEGLYRTCTGDEGCRKRGRRGCLGGRGAANAPLPRVASKHLEVSARSSFGRDRQLRSRPVSTAEQWTTPALKIPFWESVHGEPRGPATGCAATARRPAARSHRARAWTPPGRKAVAARHPEPRRRRTGSPSRGRLLWTPSRFRSAFLQTCRRPSLSGCPCRRGLDCRGSTQSSLVGKFVLIPVMRNVSCPSVQVSGRGGKLISNYADFGTKRMADSSRGPRVDGVRTRTRCREPVAGRGRARARDSPSTRAPPTNQAPHTNGPLPSIQKSSAIMRP